jgi:hypothetical protein
VLGQRHVAGRAERRDRSDPALAIARSDE